MKLQELLKQKRKEKKITLTKLAQKLNLDRTTISAWEAGRRIPNAKNLLLSVKILEISPDEIMDLKWVD